MDPIRRGYTFLAIAIVTEVIGSISLKGALERPWLYGVVAIAFLTAFGLLSLVLRAGIGIGVAYGIWGASGVALTAIASMLIFNEPLTPVMWVGIALIIIGVAAIELGSGAAKRRRSADSTFEAVPDPREEDLVTAWLYLGVAIVTEVIAALSLRMAVASTRAWYGLVVAGYLTAFVLLSLSLAAGMPLSVAYGVWTAAGVALTAILGKLLFEEPFTWVMAFGVALIIGGVMLVELGRPLNSLRAPDPLRGLRLPRIAIRL